MIDMFFIIIIFFFLVLVPYGIYKLFSKTKISPILMVGLYFSFSLLIIFLLLPNFITSNVRLKSSSVKSNMHTFQTILETYSVDASGNYPKNVEELYKFANAGKTPYWKDFKNPYTRESGKRNSYDDFSEINKKFYWNKLIQKFELLPKVGIVYYAPVFTNGVYSKYFIYGTEKNGEVFFDSQTNEPFTLSNN